jgi:hypothetical protein
MLQEGLSPQVIEAELLTTAFFHLKKIKPQGSCDN